MKIETKDLCIGYDRAIVNNINISVNDSETVVLIGPTVPVRQRFLRLFQE